MIFMSVDVKNINYVEEFIAKVPIDNHDLSPSSYKIPSEKSILSSTYRSAPIRMQGIFNHAPRAVGCVAKKSHLFVSVRQKLLAG